MNIGISPERGMERSALPPPQETQDAAQSVAGEDGAQEGHSNLLTLNLVGMIESQWQAAKQAKEPVDRRLIKCLRQVKGEYDPEKLAQIRQTGGSEVFMMLTAIKKRAAVSWLQEFLSPDDGFPFDLKPTPIVSVSPVIDQEIQRAVMMEAQYAAMLLGQVTPDQMQGRLKEVRDEVKLRLNIAAEQAAEKMKAKIEDQAAEGKWSASIDEFLDDLCTYPAAFFEGPVLRRRNRLSWAVEQALQGGSRQFKPQISPEIILEWARISPFDVFPAPDATSLNDSFLFVRRRWSITQLNALRGTPGFDDAAISTVISLYQSGGLREWISHDYERSIAENRPHEHLSASNKIDVLQYFGEVSGKLLVQHGMAGVEDESKDYHVEIWKVGQWLIKTMINRDPLGEHNVFGTCFDKVPGSIFGNALPEMMEDDQAMCNAAARSLANNLGIASGPQVVINDTSRVPQGTSITSIVPWKIWQFGPDAFNTGSHRPPIEFWQPNSLVAELSAVMETFSRKSGEHTGIPDYTYGDVGSGRGALATASGFSMAMGNAGKTIKKVVKNVDADVIERSIRKTYQHNMIWDPDPEIKGDLRCMPMGSKSIMVREQTHLRRQEFMDKTTNPVDMEILGFENRARMLKDSADELGINLTMPDAEELAEREFQMKMMSGPGLGAKNPGTPYPGRATGQDGEAAGGQKNNVVASQ